MTEPPTEASLETTPAPDATTPLEADDRYAQARMTPEWGAAAEQALERSAVLVIGAGALATPVLGYLAGAGIGRLGVLDDADVALADLYAETVHFTPDVGVPKVHSAAAKLAFLNPDIVVEPYQVHLDADNAEGLVAEQDLVVDCSNRDATRAAVAATCARMRIPLACAGVSPHGGWVISVPAGEHACPACAGTGQLAEESVPAGPVAGVLGSLLAREALRRLAGVGDTPEASVLHLDLAAPALHRSTPIRRPDCRVCGAR